MAANGNIATEQFRIDLPDQFRGSLEVLSAPDPDYDLSPEELVSGGLTDKNIYQRQYVIDRPRLLEDRDDPSGPEVIRVMGGGAQIGSIRRADCAHVHTLLANYDIVSTEVSVSGGPYKKITVSDEGEPVVAEGESRLTGTITIYYTQKSAQEETPQTAPVQPVPTPVPSAAPASSASAPARPASDPDDDDTGGWIDTSYVTEIREKNPADYGMTLLFFAGILTTCYLCFAVPCWITGRSANFFDKVVIGGLSIKEPVLLFHLITVCAALIFNIIGVFRAGNLMPALAALLYAFSGLMLPGYLFCTGLQALLCIFAALRKRKGIASIKYVLLLAVLALLGLEIYQFAENKILFNPFGDATAAGSVDDVPFVDEDIYYMDETEIPEYWDADAEDQMNEDFWAQFENESELFAGDAEEQWEEENGVIDMGLPSPLGGVSGLTGLSSRP